jgi:thiamine biosynthesis lipoprotein
VRILALAPLLGVALLLPPTGARGSDPDAVLVEVSGEAFGTSWEVRLLGDARAARALGPRLQRILDAVDRQMSSWRADSELSRFNALRDVGWFAVDRDVVRVLRAALDVHRLSGGAFDPTLAPLVELWGFGPGPARNAPPSDAALGATLARVGVGNLALRDEPPALRKTRADLALDLSGVAKGFAVDALATQLEQSGVERFLVEVGGELRARGEGPGGGPWRVGIEWPAPGTSRVAWQLGLADAALATSGDYRRYLEWGGERLPHVIDPRSGRPVTKGLVSVSVLAAEAVLADAWATALLVLGPEEGAALAEREGLAVHFVHERGGWLETTTTGAFERRLLP